jgi:hypothetical protein
MHRHASQQNADPAVDPRLDVLLRRLIGWGVLAVLLLPAARGTSAWLGWMPLWLVAMPLASWWALHRFRLPRAQAAPAYARAPRRRRGAQARRRPSARPAFARAA